MSWHWSMSLNGPWSLESVLMDMSNTLHCPSTDMIKHGVQVHERYRDLLRFILGRPTKYRWMLPEWIKNFPIKKLVKFQDMRKYQIFHDCGKPYCRTEKDGKVQYPNHEIVSYETAKRLHFPDVVCELIRLDMVCHRTDGYYDHSDNPLLPSLLLTALSEVYANAALFGGCDTDSFKIKHKKILNRIKMYMG